MPLLAFVFVLIAAGAHATWNLLAKRAAQHRNLILFSSSAEAILFLPVALGITAGSIDRLTGKAALFLLATGIIHVFYTESLQRGYRAGDLSVVYPLARGTGPLLSFFGAILLLGERPSALAGAGAFLVTSGVWLVPGGSRAFRHGARRAGLFWGVATGCTIACYTLTDGYSVKVLRLSPFLVEYAGNLFRTVVLSLRAWHERPALRKEYRQCWKEALGIAILTPAAYVLVLSAMRIAPVSRIAPMREMSMMIAAWWGSRFLGEGHAVRRVLGSALIAAGVALLAFS
ncbi:MAG TPA: DMT family transporter [Bryobacteraceae bacterium]|nr:DMT family transporter [Bryobacteraceae bacterium]